MEIKTLENFLMNYNRKAIPILVIMVLVLYAYSGRVAQHKYIEEDVKLRAEIEQLNSTVIPLTSFKDRLFENLHFTGQKLPFPHKQLKSGDVKLLSVAKTEDDIHAVQNMNRITKILREKVTDLAFFHFADHSHDGEDNRKVFEINFTKYQELRTPALFLAGKNNDILAHLFIDGHEKRGELQLGIDYLLGVLGNNDK